MGERQEQKSGLGRGQNSSESPGPRWRGPEPSFPSCPPLQEAGPLPQCQDPQAWAPRGQQAAAYWLHALGFVCPQSHRERNRGWPLPLPGVALHSPSPLQVEKSLQRIQNGQRNAMYTSQQSVENKVGGIPGWQALLTAVGFRLDPPASGLPAAVFFPTSDPGDRLQHCSSTIQSLLGEPHGPCIHRDAGSHSWKGASIPKHGSVADTDLSSRGRDLK